MLIRKKAPQNSEKQVTEPLLKSSVIQVRLGKAEASLTALESRHAQEALDSVLSGESDRLSALQAEMAKVGNAVKTLKAALVAAQKADEDTKRSMLKARKQSKIESVKINLATAEIATEALTVTLTEAIKQYKIIVEQRNKAYAIAADSTILSAGNFYCHETLLKRSVAEEIARLSGAPSLGQDCLFPGGATDEKHKYQPETITPIVEVLRLANEALLNLMARETVQ